jgi:hypothetical protein
MGRSKKSLRVGTPGGVVIDIYVTALFSGSNLAALHSDITQKKNRPCGRPLFCVRRTVEAVRTWIEGNVDSFYVPELQSV